MLFSPGNQKNPGCRVQQWHGYGPGVTISRAIVTPGNNPGKNGYK
jgi:hypothetical protein